MNCKLSTKESKRNIPILSELQSQDSLITEKVSQVVFLQHMMQEKCYANVSIS